MKISQETKTWLNAHPDSYHELDRERWFKAIKASITENEPIDFDEVEIYLRENTQWETDFIEKFIEEKESEYRLIISFFKFYSA